MFFSVLIKTLQDTFLVGPYCDTHSFYSEALMWFNHVNTTDIRPRPHEDDCKRKLFYAIRPSVHTKTMKKLTVNA